MGSSIPDLIICFIIIASLALAQVFAHLWRIALGGDSSNLKLAQLADQYSHQYGWIIKLILNCFGYGCILLPAFIIYQYTNAIKYLDKSGDDTRIITRIVRCCLKGRNSQDQSILPTSNVQPPIDKGKDLLAPSHRRSFWAESCPLVYCFVGLMGSYLWWGVLQERIMTQEYIRLENGVEVRSHFKESQFLVFANRSLAFVIAGIYLLFAPGPRHQKATPLYKYSVPSLSNILSAWFQYEALKFVNFPTQVLAKSCKVIPVMVMGKVVFRTKYQSYEYITAVMISMGMLCFMLGSADDPRNGSAVTTLSGVFLLIMYLVSDSFTSNWQDKLFQTYSMTSIQMMFGVNLFSCLFTASSLTIQGGFLVGFQFAMHHPPFIWDCVTLSVCAAVGQLFIFYTIARFGPVVFTIIMTLRQAIAILLSCWIYKHHISYVGYLGIITVFLAVFLRVYGNQRKRQIRRNQAQTPKASDEVPLFENAPKFTS